MTLDDLFAELTIASTHQDLYRNIVSLRESENLFDDLSDNPLDWAEAVKVELQAKPSNYASPTPAIHRPFEEALWLESVEYPFKHWMRSRYSDGSFGVWYGASELETTVFETVHHWTHGLLADADFLQPGVVQERRIHLVQCDASLMDLRPLTGRIPALLSKDDYVLTQQIGARMHQEGLPGLVTRSARCEGDAHAILNPGVLTNPRAFCYLTYTTSDAGVTVDRAPGDGWMQVLYT